MGAGTTSADEGLKIEITRYTAELEHPYTLFEVTLLANGGSWTEVYNEHELPIFLRGVEAAHGTLMGAGALRIPEIPREVAYRLVMEV